MRRHLNMKRFVRSTAGFVIVWVICVTSFLVLFISRGPSTSSVPFLPVEKTQRVHIRNVADTSYKTSADNKKSKAETSKNAVTVLPTKENVNSRIEILNNVITTQKPNHWNAWKHNLIIQNASINDIPPHVRVVKKGYLLAEVNGSNTSRPVMEKLPASNDSQKIVFMRNKAAENRYYALKTAKVNVINSEFTITGAQICDAGSPFLLIIVPSIPSHYDVRNVIRSTYGSYARNDGNVHRKTNSTLNETVKLLFLVGKDGNLTTSKMLKDESRKYGDIVQADFQESYYNLTMKMILALKWISLYCSEIDYFLKADEDVFVNVPRLVKMLKLRPHDMRGTVYGFINYQSAVRRSGKWKVAWKEFPLPYYPPYASGNTYVISGNVIPRMFMMSEYFPYVPIEDAYVTGILARVVEATHVTIRGFTYWEDSEPKPCNFVKTSKISATKVTKALMLELWKALTSFNKYCRYNVKRV